MLGIRRLFGKKECACFEGEEEDPCIAKYKDAYDCYLKNRENEANMGTCLLLYREMRACYSRSAAEKVVQLNLGLVSEVRRRAAAMLERIRNSLLIKIE